MKKSLSAHQFVTPTQARAHRPTARTGVCCAEENRDCLKSLEWRKRGSRPPPGKPLDGDFFTRLKAGAYGRHERRPFAGTTGVKCLVPGTTPREWAQRTRLAVGIATGARDDRRRGCGFAAPLDPDEEGRLVVHFPDLPEALTDGADQPEALSEAADCLSTALAACISIGEDIPPPSRLRPGQHLGAPDATMALKAALYSALRRRRMTVADLARRLDIDHRQAARLVDPRAASQPTSLEAALTALGCALAIEVHEKPAA